MLPNYFELAIKYGISRAKDTYGYGLVTIKEMLHDTRYQECGGGYDMLGSALGQFIQDNFQPALLELTGQIKNFYGMRKNQSGSIIMDGACGLDSMILILTDLLGYEVSYEYKRDRQGRPERKIAIILKKKNIPTNTQLYSDEQILQKPVFNVNKHYNSVTELFFHGDIDLETVGYYIRKNPEGKFVALKGHSNQWYLQRVPKAIISEALKKGS